jgi:uroporphyrinogen-III synthase
VTASLRDSRHASRRRISPSGNGGETAEKHGTGTMPTMKLGPLAGYTVGITADRRSEEQAQLLERRGARVVYGATIRTLPLGEEGVLRQATERVIAQPPDAAVLITGLGTRGWFAAAECLNLGEQLHAALGGAALYARGPKAAGAAITAGLEVAWKAPNARTLELIDRIEADRAAGVLKGNRVVVQLDGSDDRDALDRLAELGFEVVPVPVYRWKLPLDTTPAVRLVQSVADRTIDAVTFTSGPALANFFTLADDEGVTGAVLDACNAGAVDVVCVGPVCAARARSHGVLDTVEPAHPRLGAMVQVCAARFAERSRRLQLAGHDVTVQGRLVLVDSCDPITLSDRERGVLDALAERPGAVQSKAALLKAVWGGGENDEHVVEVTVGRLRQRLGSAGQAVETVVRRGYRLAPG